MSKILKCAIAAAAAFTMQAQAAGTPVIDAFTKAQSISDLSTGCAVGDPATTSCNGGRWATQVQDASIFGGYRDIYVEKYDEHATNTVPGANPGDDPIFAGEGVRASAVAGKFSFSEDVNQNGLAILRWDGSVASTGTAPGSVSVAENLGSLLALGNGVAVTYTSDFVFNISICVYTTLTDFSCAAQTTSFTGVNVYKTDTVLWSEFVSGLLVGSTGAADFANVHAIEVIFNGNLAQASIDLAFSTTKLPEPASLALAGLALLGMGAARRRKA